MAFAAKRCRVVSSGVVVRSEPLGRGQKAKVKYGLLSVLSTDEHPDGDWEDERHIGNRLRSSVVRLGRAVKGHMTLTIEEIR
jgi:hypothetical protein